MRIRRYLGICLAASVLGAAAFAVSAQDATPTLDPALPTTDPMMATTDPMMATVDPLTQGGMMGESAMAPIMDASGAQVGWASFTNSMGMPGMMPPPGSTPVAPDPAMMASGKVLVTVQLNSATLTPGFHGMHLHMMGNCGDTGEGPFTGAGGHIPTEPVHPNHVGDFPAALVNNDGTAYVSFETDRFTMADLLDADGTAIILHANPDNYAHIPERYGTPDEETLNTGDAGPRLACGVLQAGMAPMPMPGMPPVDPMGSAPTLDPALVPTMDPAMMPTTDPAAAPTATAG